MITKHQRRYNQLKNKSRAPGRIESGDWHGRTVKVDRNWEILEDHCVNRIQMSTIAKMHQVSDKRINIIIESELDRMEDREWQEELHTTEK